jgi:peroxiredoxin
MSLVPAVPTGTDNTEAGEQTHMVALDSEDVLDRGDAAPAFELPGTDGESHSLSEFEAYDGLLVTVTCNHCPYAKAKFEEMNRLAAEYDEVAVVGINPNDADEYPEDDFETMRERVADGTIQFDAYLRDESQDVAAAYGARCTPDPFLFENTAREDTSLDDEATSGEGPFHLLYHGRLDDALNPDETAQDREMRAHIDAMLAGESVTDDFRPSRGCSIKWKPGNEP